MLAATGDSPTGTMPAIPERKPLRLCGTLLDQFDMRHSSGLSLANRVQVRGEVFRWYLDKSSLDHTTFAVTEILRWILA